MGSVGLVWKHKWEQSLAVMLHGKNLETNSLCKENRNTVNVSALPGQIRNGNLLDTEYSDSPTNRLRPLGSPNLTMPLKFPTFVKRVFGSRTDAISGKNYDRTSEWRDLRTGTKINLDEWVEHQKVTYGTRKQRPGELERAAARFNGTLLGIKGTILDRLVSQSPHMIPKNFWGDDLGWRSVKRRSDWGNLLAQKGFTPTRTDTGILVRFFIEGVDWIPHPYLPPTWATSTLGTFSTYIAPSESAYKLCLQWKQENSETLYQKISQRLSQFSVRVAANYLAHESVDYADVAFLLGPN